MSNDLFDINSYDNSYDIRPDDFKEYDENIEVNCRCPECNYKWSEIENINAINSNIFAIIKQNQLTLFDSVLLEPQKNYDKIICPRCRFNGGSNGR